MLPAVRAMLLVAFTEKSMIVLEQETKRKCQTGANNRHYFCRSSLATKTILKVGFQVKFSRISGFLPQSTL